MRRRRGGRGLCRLPSGAPPAPLRRPLAGEAAGHARRAGRQATVPPPAPPGQGMPSRGRGQRGRGRRRDRELYPAGPRRGAMGAMRRIGGLVSRRRGPRAEPAGDGAYSGSAIREEYRGLYQKFLDRKADARIEPFLRLLLANGLIDCRANPREAVLDTRIKIQKLVYFAQECFGLTFRYRHTLYIYGPYSPELANDYYRISDIGDIPDGGLEDWAGREEFLGLAASHNSAEWLEIAGTLLYIYRNEPLSIDRLIFRAKRVRRKYSRGRIVGVYGDLIGCGFIRL